MNMHTVEIVRPPAAPRAALREAIAERDAAAAREREAAGTLDRADRLAADTQRRLAALDRVDQEILDHSAAAYRAYAETAGDILEVTTPKHLEEKRIARDAVRQELAGAKAAQSQLADRHRALQAEREKCDRVVSQAADRVIVEESTQLYVRYVQAVREAREAFDDMAAICGITQQTGPTWAMRAQLPGLPELVTYAVELGFGYRADPPPGQVRPPGREAVWQRLRERLRVDADATL